MGFYDIFVLLFSEGIISGVITGVIVGLIVWAFQLRREKSDIRHRYDREISILRERLHFVNYNSRTISLSSVLQAQPIYIHEILAILKNHPLDLIEIYAYHNKALATKLQELKLKYFEVRQDAEHLDILLENFIRRSCW